LGATVEGSVIQRDLDRASDDRFDLAVVGGGVYGIALTLEASRRGLKTLLVERKDFGGATSWNSLRILHGGLRYLQSFDLPRFHDSTIERSRWLESFPSLTAPLPCLMPLDNRGLRRTSILRLALTANNLLSRRGNDNLRGDRRLPASRILSPTETREWFSDDYRPAPARAALWYDGQVTRPQRLLVEMLRSAVASGATALNRCAAIGLVKQGDRVAGLEIVDRLTGAQFSITSPVVVNCAGPWCIEVAKSFDRKMPDLFYPSLAMNVIIEHPTLSPAAIAVRSPSPGGQTYFLLPWQGRVLAGTYHRVWHGPVSETVDVDEMALAFLHELNLAVPEIEIGADKLLKVLWGFLPVDKPGSESLTSRAQILHHAERGGPIGLFTLSGVKFTTARSAAAKTLDRVSQSMGIPLGERIDTPVELALACPTASEFATLMQSDRPGAAALVQRIVREESVQSVQDLLYRRTDWGNWLEASADFELKVGQLVGLAG
jgi:glycerol-3-phosphate dehydrogenase